MSLKGKCIDFPIVAQEKNYTCGTACVEAYLKFNGIKRYDEDTVAALVHSNPNYGTSYKDIVSFFDRKGFQPIVRHKLSVNDIIKILSHKRPLLTCIQAYSSDKSPDYKDKWDDGHYVVIVGYDDFNFYFMDPSDAAADKKYAYIPIHEYMERAHDLDGEDNQKLIGFGIMVLNLNNIDPPTKPMNKKMCIKMP